MYIKLLVRKYVELNSKIKNLPVIPFTLYEGSDPNACI